MPTVPSVVSSGPSSSSTSETPPPSSLSSLLLPLSLLSFLYSSFEYSTGTFLEVGTVDCDRGRVHARRRRRH